MTRSSVPQGWRRIDRSQCPHLSTLAAEARPDKDRCEACGGTSDLRVCLTCGYVGCCESHGAHDTRHFEETGHPFIRPQGLPDPWLWCYECKAFLH